MVMDKQVLTKLEAKMAKLEKENLRLKTKQIKVNKKKEKEISRLKTKQIKEISRLKTRLAKEDSLWNTELGQMRHSSVLPTRLLHAQEMLEYVLSDEKMINALTRNTKEIFYDTLEDLTRIIKKSNDARTFGTTIIEKKSPETSASCISGTFCS